MAQLKKFTLCRGPLSKQKRP